MFNGRIELFWLWSSLGGPYNVGGRGPSGKGKGSAFDVQTANLVLIVLN